jgi:hypothetical protein
MKGTILKAKKLKAVKQPAQTVVINIQNLVGELNVTSKESELHIRKQLVAMLSALK